MGRLNIFPRFCEIFSLIGIVHLIFFLLELFIQSPKQNLSLPLFPTSYCTPVVTWKL